MKKTFKIKNLGCANCAAKMERRIKKLDGVDSASVSFMTSRLTIEADDERIEEIARKADSICRGIEPGCAVEL
ncbi:MAG: heavy-metal-associated domain-containing protein [Clostridiales bacterium]|nr:heavy-metal-associated domain-containing protein [Clostridiales bacterium]